MASSQVPLSSKCLKGQPAIYIYTRSKELLFSSNSAVDSIHYMSHCAFQRDEGKVLFVLCVKKRKVLVFQSK